MKLAFRVLGLCLAALIGAGALVPEVRAQASNGNIVLAQAERPERPGIFRFLFRNRRREQQERRVIIVPAPQQLQPPARQTRPKQGEAQRGERRKKARPSGNQRDSARPGKAAKGSEQAKEVKPRKQRKKRAAVAAAPPAKLEPVEKAPDAKRVLVIGDFMAESIAKGLIETYEQNPNAVVIDATSGDSGLVRSDHYDWALKLPELVAEHKPDAIVMLIGANDRQPIGTDAGAQALDSEGWRAAYGARVSALAEALKATAKPVLWAGLPPVRPAGTSRHYSTVNGVVREQLEPKGLPFVDTWNGFVDEAGKFVQVGPDVGGQSAQLRTGDGLNFTRPGQRKLAFFLEQPLNDILGGALPAVAALDPAAASGAPAPAGPAEQVPRISAMVPIEALVTGGGDLLSAAAPNPAPGAPPPGALPGEPAVVATIGRRLNGDGAAAPAGRTDNYAWPAPQLVVPPPPPPGAPPAGPGAPQVAAGPVPPLLPPAPAAGSGPVEPAPAAPAVASPAEPVPPAASDQGAGLSQP